MKYANPKIPEEINYSKENPLKEFLLLVAGILAVVAVFVIVTQQLTQQFAQHIPFEYEAKIVPTQFIENNFLLSNNSEKKDYLTSLANKLAQHMDLPKAINLQVYYLDSAEINAFASLNGIIIITEGLLKFVQSENELAFVIAHEIGHIKERHPIKSLSSGLVIGATIAIIGGSINNDSAANALITGSSLTALNFSRAQESQADTLALYAIHKHYGHTLGSIDFFTRLKEQSQLPTVLSFTSTHPDHNTRITDAQALAQTLTNNISASLTALPTFK
ncbi:MAG: putative Zn-dependent protease [Candidatus Endobugula sp.]|jgi:predicted Zn-dependent protease